jgi:DNA-binding NarL/FixJ family response regulator
MEMVRVLILNKNRLFRESLAFVLRQHISVVYTVGSISELEVYLDEPHPDVIIIELGVPPVREGLKDALSARTIYPGAKILFLGLQEQELETEVVACFEEGEASGYLLDNASVEEVVHNVRAVLNGEVICSPRAASFLASRMGKRREARRGYANDRINSLTPRECEVIDLIEAGLSNKEIASHLHIEVQTVKNHVHNILHKLQGRRRREAVILARQQGLERRSSLVLS